MLTYSNFKDVQEHNPLAVRNIIKKINPIKKLRDKLGRKGLAGNAKKALQKKLDALNPLSDINKARTMAKKKDLRGLKDKRDSIKQKLGVLNVQINDLEDETRTENLDEDMCAVPKHKLSSKVMRAAWEKKCGDKTPKKEKDTAIRRAGKKAGLSRKEREKLYNENEPNLDERMMTDKQKLVQIQHYWDGLNHMASDNTKKKSLERLGYKNIKLDSRGKITSFDEELESE